MATLNDLLSFLQGASNSAASTVSAPVDGINWILKKAGFPVSDKPVGGSDWLKDKGLMAEPKNQNLGYVGEAIGGVLPMVAAAKAPQIASALNQMGANMAAPRTLNPQTGAIVWHGSPHKFDKFDASKIGTGEGAQAYGHGIYTAEAKEVAKEYARMNLTGPANVAHVAGRDGGDSLTALKAVYPGMPADWYENAIRKGKESANLYKIDLPDEHIAKMLDWDKPLSQQAPEVRMIAKDLGVSEQEVGAKFYQALTNQARDGAIARGHNAGTTLGASQAAASDDLRAFGIPGIRYLDGGSRGVGQGTSNFVIFPGNEGLLSILERNGIPLD